MCTEPYSEPLTIEAPVSVAARRTMHANRRRDTRPELLLRSQLHGEGFRFRVDHPLPFDRRRRADLVFTRVGLYVFVDGCFWHGCPTHFVVPKTRRDFWLRKIDRNRERDADTDARLRLVGLESIRLWEHVPAVDATALVVEAYRRRAEGVRSG